MGRVTRHDDEQAEGVAEVEADAQVAVAGEEEVELEADAEYAADFSIRFVWLPQSPS